MQRSNLKLIVNHRGGPSDSSGAMPQAAGPSRSFLSLTRNPDLAAPARFEPTVKAEGDIVL